MTIVTVLLAATLSRGWATAPPPTSNSPWSISGLQPGLTRAEAQDILGEAVSNRVPIDDDHIFQVLIWKGPQVSLSFVDDRVESRHVNGRHIKFGGRKILVSGDSIEKIVKLLGPPEHNGNDYLIYEREYEMKIWLSEQGFRSVEFSKLPNQRKPLPKAVSPY